MKKARGILIILILINIACLIYLLILPKEKTYDYTSYAVAQEDIKRQNGEIKDFSVKENNIKLENEAILLSNYQGELATGKVNQKFTDLINGGFQKLYSDTKGMNSKNLEAYLEANKEDIVMKTGITGIVDFYAFIEKLQIYKDNITFEKAEIVENSYKNGNQYDNFIVRISYNNGKNLDFVVLLSNKDFIDTPIIIIK